MSLSAYNNRGSQWAFERPDMEHRGDEINAEMLEYDRFLRWQIMLGCEQAKQIELKLKGASSVYLEQAECDTIQGVSSGLIDDAAAVVSTFSTVLSFLSSCPSMVSTFAAGPTAWEQTHPADVIFQDTNLKEIGYAGGEQIFCPRRQDSGTPPVSPRVPSTSDLCSYAQLCPCSRVSLTPSPPLETDPKLFQGILSTPPLIATSSSMEPEPLKDRAECPEFESRGVSSHRQRISKRRKFLRTWVARHPVNITERGTEALPADGYSWRKYGQKEIQNSSHPRSYYRCTYQKELGCLATKHLQRSDADPSVLCVKYYGDHTCHMVRQIHQAHSWSPPYVARSRPQKPIIQTCATTSSSKMIDPADTIRLGPYAASPLSESLTVPYTRGSQLFNYPCKNASSIMSPTSVMTPKSETDPISMRGCHPVNPLFLDETDQSRPTETSDYDVAALMMNLLAGSDGCQTQMGWNSHLGQESSVNTPAEYSACYQTQRSLEKELPASQITSFFTETDSYIQHTSQAYTGWS
ncbi:hypothetical protein O6H91_21G065800 [Diphasiastrum complanatum]|uniref:Uncharacterized protein n=3 Tax=Diphasiastrum complanatum TaxID=34168 RepID=A0ACC2ALF5_DIPCM|nr:hypothetical protein O6H91_21G065800 [Diphasiastrum complanatum]KAJ7518367.1 hypothetical protein O6H91_21G065800 [Diphasiastrum complanatum]KAJ7518368.1 hypothetical protein O6H91_21G065800 [Diphasiastrum complanatum]